MYMKIMHSLIKKHDLDNLDNRIDFIFDIFSKYNKHQTLNLPQINEMIASFGGTDNKLLNYIAQAKIDALGREQFKNLFK